MISGSGEAGCSCTCPPGPIQTLPSRTIQTTGGGHHHKTIACCKVFEQLGTISLCGSNELCLLSMACSRCPGAQHPRRAVAPCIIAAHRASQAYAAKTWDPGGECILPGCPPVALIPRPACSSWVPDFAACASKALYGAIQPVSWLVYNARTPGMGSTPHSAGSARWSRRAHSG